MRIFIATERMENFKVLRLKSDVDYPSIENFKVPMAFYILNMSIHAQLEILTPNIASVYWIFPGSIYMFFYFMSPDLA